MSKSSDKTAQNFETLYYSLKDEFHQVQNDNIEIFKEYDSTIQILTESITQLQNQLNIMNKKLSQIEKEKQNLQNKNFDKIIDIQDLSKKNEKLSQEIKIIKEDKKIKDTKIVVLENDTEHFQQLIRQNEAIIDELNIKLEEALEDNITIQSEFDIYKQIMGEQIMRKDEEIKDIKNDMFSKNLVIKKLEKMKENINSPIKEGILSSFKKNKNKSEVNSSSTQGKGSNLDKNELFNNIIINSIFKSCTPSPYYTKSKSKNKQMCSLSPLLPSLNNIKLSQIKGKYLYHHLNSDSLKKSYKDINTNRTPSSNKIQYIHSFYSGNTHKKNYSKVNGYKSINKFDICDINEIEDKEKSFDLNSFKNEENNSTVTSGKKLVKVDIIGYNKKYVDIAPFEDSFLKKILNSQKDDFNWEKSTSNYQDKDRKKNVSCFQNGIQKMKNMAKRLNKYNIFTNVSLKNIVTNVCKCSSKIFSNYN
jgi:hypothetical protein